MQYPLISEYREAILNAEDNFDQLSDLVPVLDAKGEPIMSSGNFAVVFKMTDGEKDYAVKCFIKEQEGRDEAYRRICQYLPNVPSPYLVPTQYLEKELFVDTNQSDDQEFPVLLMDWVEGISLDRYVKSIRHDPHRRVQLANRFRELLFWLLHQEFAHGDLKPDNIIVTETGELVLVDYDGMFVPSMRGQQARELGTPLYRFKGRAQQDFDAYADDYAGVFILLVLMADCFEPMDFDGFTSAEPKDILSHFTPYIEQSHVAPYMAAFLLVASSGRLERPLLYPLLAYRSLPQPAAPSRQTFTVNGISFEMIPVEGGTFMMGATEEQGGDADGDEKPAHQVTLGSYAIGKYPVTQALWKAVMGNNPSRFKGDDLPVECVSWDDCQKFIEKLNKLTGKTFRLPTEAEWEYAARGGQKSKGYKYSGSNNIGEVAWYYNNSGSMTHSVGQKKPNELGLYDMSGNVLEWCHDWDGGYPSAPQTNPTGPTTGSGRVRRGGGWFIIAWSCRVSGRGRGDPGGWGSDLGLRLVLQTENCQPVYCRQNVESNKLAYTIGGVSFEMIPVEGGTFMMGATEEQGGNASDWEKPVHQVTLGSYAIGKYPVTQALWKAVMGENPSYFKGDDLPVEKVSWYDCWDFIQKLNKLTGQTFRLPTEAEWEYAARGGQKRQGYKFSGSNDLGEVAWYDANSGGKTHPVGQKKPNELGLYDMSGNVLEWCHDWDGGYPSAPQTNPTGPTTGSGRVRRGGSWFIIAWSCRVSGRGRGDPGGWGSDLGLRLAQTL